MLATQIRWASAGILSAVLLARRRQMALARCHFAHRANLIANRWFDVGPTPVTQQALHAYNFLYMPMAKCQPFSFKYHVGPTLVRHDLLAPSINMNSLDIFYFFYTWCFCLQLTINSLNRSGMA